MERGVKVVGAVPADEADDKGKEKDEGTPTDGSDDAADPPRPPSAVPAAPSPARAARPSAIVGVVAALGVLGTLDLRRPLRHEELGPDPGPRRPQRLADVPDRLLQLQRQDGRLGLQRRHDMATGAVLVAGQAVLQLEHPQGARAGAGRVPWPDPLPRRAAGGQPARDGVDLRRHRPDLRQQQDHHAPGPTSSASSPTSSRSAGSGRSPTSRCSRAPRPPAPGPRLGLRGSSVPASSRRPPRPYRSTRRSVPAVESRRPEVGSTLHCGQFPRMPGPGSEPIRVRRDDGAAASPQ